MQRLLTIYIVCSFLCINFLSKATFAPNEDNLLVSVPYNVQGNYAGNHPSVSADGRYVVFDSASDDLVAGAHFFSSQIYLRDVQERKTILISATIGEDPYKSRAEKPIISGTGRYVIFSRDDNIFRYDRNDNVTELVSVTLNGSSLVSGSGSAEDASFSSDGRFVAFSSTNNNITIDDSPSPNGLNNSDVFVRDMLLKKTLKAPRGTRLGFVVPSNRPSISANGRYIVFTDDSDAGLHVYDIYGSTVTDLNVSSVLYAYISDDGQYIVYTDIWYENLYVFNTQTKTSRTVNIGFDGSSANKYFDGGKEAFAISESGRYIAFSSDATNLISSSGTSGIFVRDLVENTTKQIATQVGQVAISTDGQKVAYASQGVYLYGYTNVPVPNDPDRVMLVNALIRLRDVTITASSSDANILMRMLAQSLDKSQKEQPERLQEMWRFILADGSIQRLQQLGVIAIEDAEDLARLNKIRNLFKTGAVNTVSGDCETPFIYGNIADYTGTEEEIYQKLSPSFDISMNNYVARIYDYYQLAIDRIPNPLPSTYPVKSVVSLIDEQVQDIQVSIQREVKGLLYDTEQKQWIKFPIGVMNARKQAFSYIIDNISTASRISRALSISKLGPYIVGAGLKIASVFTGPGIIPSEIVIWGQVATTNEVIDILDDGTAMYQVTMKGQFIHYLAESELQFRESLKLRCSEFRGTGDYILDQLSASLTRYAATNVQQSATPLQLTIDSVVTPDIVTAEYQNSAEGLGQLTLHNAGTTAMSVRGYGTIVANVEGSMQTVAIIATDAVTIDSGVQHVLALPYTLPRSTFVNGTAYMMHLTVLAQQSSGPVVQLGPVVSRFFVGTSAQLVALSAQAFQTRARDALSADQQRNHMLVFAPSTQTAHIMLSFGESGDFDLHLYDAQGRHIGLNATTGQIDVQIPGARYSGPDAWPEWIELPSPGNQQYTATVGPHPGAQGGSYDLSTLEIPTLPVLFDAPANIVWSITRLTPTAQVTATFTLPLYEASTIHIVEQIQTEVQTFHNADGIPFPASQMACSASTESSQTRKLIACTVTVPPDFPFGTFVGVLRVTGIAEDATPLTLASQISLQMIDGRYQVRLPLVTAR